MSRKKKREGRGAPAAGRIAVLGLALWGAGCSAADYSARAERSARRLLEERHETHLGAREETAALPLEAAAEEGVDAEPSPAPAPAREARMLDLRSALAVAYVSNRGMLARREALESQGLSLDSVRHGYTPQLALTLGYLFDEQPHGPDVHAGTVGFSASQILPTGGVLSLDAASAATAEETSSPRYDSLVSIQLAQPLLRGAGHAITHEPLIQAERNLVYALRDFELFREDFSIDVANRYYGLVNQKKSIDNQARNLASNEFGRRQAEALFAVGRANELDVLRARRSELTARNSLLEAEERLQLALDQFRIFLGLPADEPVDMLAEPPPYTPMSYELGSAIEVAFANRLDLINRREQLEDVERALRIARDGLLPDLDLRLGTAFATESSGDLGGRELDRSGASASLNLGLPLDRVRERNSYRGAELALSRARRDLEEFEDQLQVEIKSSFRELARRLQSLEIQRQLIEDQTKNLRIAELRFERGEIANRDVVEANQSLLDAQNSLIDEQVSYEIARLRLLRDLGILFIDDSGMWKR